ncbi:MAG: DUF5668 domain-containing protein, partial [Bacteroidales bacterium]|jgi:hypothetical protein|nr:DUF5668 domain-containing protein [Bacteroidales bacterium]
MKDGFSHKIFSGVFFITIGILWLLNSVDIIDISWRDIWHLWPLILIWIGISCLPIKGVYRLILNGIVLLAGVLFLVIPNPFSAKHCANNKENESCTESISCIEYSTTIDTNTIDFPYSDATLNVNVGAGTFRIEPSDIVAVSTGKDNLSMNTQLNGNSRHADVTAESKNRHVNTKQEFVLGLNTNPVWDMNFEMGAVDAQLDLSLYKVRKMELETGASALNLRLGDRYADVEAEIEVGASSLTIEVPKTMRCIVEKESALVDFSLDNFKKSSGNKYVAEAEGQSKGTIKLDISAGVATVKVVRY